MSSESKDTTIPAVHFISSPDGDVILRSSDGVEFRADSAVLKRASPVFEDMAKLPPPKNEPLAPPVLVMEETNDVLDLLLRLLYPADAPQIIASDSQGRGLLRVTDKLQITSHIVIEALEAYIATIEPPLVAWALTMTSGIPSVRSAGVRRVFAADESTDLNSDVPDELAAVSARAVIQLLAAKKEALKKSKSLFSFSSFPWACQREYVPPHMRNGGSPPLKNIKCATADWSINHTRMILRHPFEPRRYSETTLQDMIIANEDVDIDLFNLPTFVAQRAKARAEVAILLQI